MKKQDIDEAVEILSNILFSVGGREEIDPKIKQVIHILTRKKKRKE